MTPPVEQPLRIAVIIAAAGTSTRFNTADPAGPLEDRRSKLDEDLGGRPVLQRAVELFTARDEVAAVIVAGPHDENAMAEFKLRHGDRLELLGATLCRGGADYRWQSVKAALQLVPPDATHVAVHDAARPVTSPGLIDRVFRAAAAHPAVIPALPVSDTVKKLSAEPVSESRPADPLAGILGDEAADPPPRRVTETLDRTDLALVQTPQVFDAARLKAAYDQPDVAATDDASLVELAGAEVVAVAGDPMNIKITVPRDVELARVIGGFAKPRERPTHKKF